MRLTAFILLTFLTVQMCAQNNPVIVKDYNDCTYGLQDENGKWLAQPVYSQIEPFHHELTRVSRGGYWGMMNRNGKEVIPAIYDEVRFSCNTSKWTFQREDLIVVEKNGKTGIVDSTGKMIVPVKYEMIGCICDGIFPAMTTEREWILLHENGIEYPVKSSEEPRLFAQHIYLVRQFVTDTNGASMRVGLVGEKGEEIVPTIYHEIIPGIKFPIYEVRLNNNYGYLDSTFNTIVDCSNQVWIHKSNYNQTVSSMLFIGKTGIRNKNGKIGVINWQGDTIIPVQFDSIRETTWWSNYGSRTQFFWEACLNNKWGVLDSAGSWLLQPQFDELSIHSYYTRKTSLEYYQSSYAVVKWHNKYGAINMNGDTLIRTAYDTVFSRNNSYSPIFWSPDDVVRIQLNTANNGVGISYASMDQRFKTRKKIRKMVISSAQFFYDGYRFNPGNIICNYLEWSVNPEELTDREFEDSARRRAYPFIEILPVESQLSLVHYEKVRTEVPGYFTYRVNNFRYWNLDVEVIVYDSIQNQVWLSHTFDQNEFIYFGPPHLSQGILTTDGKLIIPPGKFLQVRYQGELHAFEVYTKSGCGLIDTSGKLIVDTAWAAIRKHGRRYLWLCAKAPEADDACDENWCLYDYISKEMIVDSSVHASQPLLQGFGKVNWLTRDGLGLVNAATFEFLIPPIYAAITPMDDSSLLYAVTTCSGKVGVYDLKRGMVVDTAYTQLYLLEARPYGRGFAELYHETYLLYNGDSSYFFFPDRPINDSSYIDRCEHILELVSDQSRLDAPRGFRRSYVKFNKFTNSSANDSLPQWQMEWLLIRFFDPLTSRGDYRSYLGTSIPACACNVPGRVAPFANAKENRVRRINVTYSSDSALSYVQHTEYTHDNSYRNPYWYEYRTTYNTEIMTINGFQRIALEELFVDTLWRNIVIDSVLSYLEAHPQINADCSRPKYIPNQFSEYFVLSPTGIFLYPAWYKNTDGSYLYAQPVIFIPWSALDPHLRPEMRERINHK